MKPIKKAPPMGKRPPLQKGTFKRLLKFLLSNYKKLLAVMLTCLVISAITGSIAGIFLERIYTSIGYGLEGVLTVSQASKKIISVCIILLCIYLIGWISNLTMGLVGAKLTQLFLKDLRVKMFAKMQTLPIKYFDRRNHGDTMSVYTNDIDALRQLVSQSLPQLCSTIITLVCLTCVMLYMSVILWLVVVIGIIGIVAGGTITVDAAVFLQVLLV